MPRSSGFEETFKNGRPKPKPNNGKPSEIWDFTCPTYDERTSCFVNAGTNYGVGKAQPVGHSGDAKERVPCLPFGKVKTMQVDET